MDILAWILLFTAGGAVLGVVAASSVLLLPGWLMERLLPRLVSFAIGALLAAAMLGLLPHALEGMSSDATHGVMAVVLAGVLVFFALEKMVLWRHCHAGDCEAHAPGFDHAHRAATGWVILVGDTIHNLVDGILIAAAFLTDPHLGVVTSIAVFTHEVPQEVGDFVIMLDSGFGRWRTFLYNLLSSLGTIVGGVVAWLALSRVQFLVPYVLALAVSSFLYVAMSDLIPNLHRRTEARATIEQLVLIVLGITVMAVMHSTLH